MFWNLGLIQIKWCDVSVCISMGCDAVTHAISLSKSISTYADELIRAACWDETSRSGIVSIPVPKQMQIKIQINVFSPRRNGSRTYSQSLSRWQDSVIRSSWKTRHSQTAHCASVQKSLSPVGETKLSEKETGGFCEIVSWLWNGKHPRIPRIPQFSNVAL